MSKLICTNVLRQAWNNEQVTLESDDLKAVIEIKNPELHGQVSKGDEFDTTEAAVKKIASKKSKAKKTTK